MMTSATQIICTLGLLVLVGCAQPATEKELIQQACREPRPMICTMDYNPVCGLRGDSWQTYSNACGACSDAEVSGYRNGECADEK